MRRQLRTTVKCLISLTYEIDSSNYALNTSVVPSSETVTALGGTDDFPD